MSKKKQDNSKKQSKFKASCFQGQILVAMPSLTDPRFREAVIFMCGHDEQGAMGIMVNKLIDNVYLEDIVDQIDITPSGDVPRLPIHYGGPVEIGRGFVLHTTDFLSDSSVEITDDIALTASTKIFEYVLKGHGPNHLLIALGYAGWSQGQLEDEIMQNSWLVLPADASLLFDRDPSSLWKRTLKKFGIDPNCLSLHSGRA